MNGVDMKTRMEAYNRRSEWRLAKMGALREAEKMSRQTRQGLTILIWFVVIVVGVVLWLLNHFHIALVVWTVGGFVMNKIVHVCVSHFIDKRLLKAIEEMHPEPEKLP